MREWFKQLDRILRGEATRLPDLREGKIEMPVAGLSVVVILLAMVYGACMGCYAIFGASSARPIQLLASAVKLPMLFFLTLLVTFPSLYVFNALVGSRLSMASMARLLVASLAVLMAILASLGPIVAFFSVCTTSYPFIKVLNVLAFVIAGLLGLRFLLQTLQRLTIAPVQPLPVLPEPLEPPESADAPEGSDEAPPDEVAPPRLPGALDAQVGGALGSHVRTIFRFWIIIFGLVGAQMSWLLRPFIGNPDQPFTWFRVRESNFFEAVIKAIGAVFTGGG